MNLHVRKDISFEFLNKYSSGCFFLNYLNKVST